MLKFFLTDMMLAVQTQTAFININQCDAFTASVVPGRVCGGVSSLSL